MLEYEAQVLAASNETGQASLELYLTAALWFHPEIQNCIDYVRMVCRIFLRDLKFRISRNQKQWKQTSQQQFAMILKTQRIRAVIQNWSMSSNHSTAFLTRYRAETCCLPREQTLAQQSIQTSPSLTSTCLSPECAQSLIDSFGDHLLSYRYPLLPYQQFFIADAVYFWTDCIDEVFKVRISTNFSLLTTLEPRHEVLWGVLELCWLSGRLSLWFVVELVYRARKGRLRSFVCHVLSAEHTAEDPIQNRWSPSRFEKRGWGRVFYASIKRDRLYYIFWTDTRNLYVTRRATSKRVPWVTCHAKWYVQILSVTPVANMTLRLQCMSGWVPCQCRATVVPPEVSLIMVLIISNHQISLLSAWSCFVQEAYRLWNPMLFGNRM